MNLSVNHSSFRLTSPISQKLFRQRERQSLCFSLSLANVCACKQEITVRFCLLPVSVNCPLRYVTCLCMPADCHLNFRAVHDASMAYVAIPSYHELPSIHNYYCFIIRINDIVLNALNEFKYISLCK